MSVPAPLFAMVLGFVALCMASDLRTRRIPNAITGPAMLAGAAFNVLYGGRAGLLASLGGLALGAAILLPPFAAGGLGGGGGQNDGAGGAPPGPPPAPPGPPPGARPRRARPGPRPPPPAPA